MRGGGRGGIRVEEGGARVGEDEGVWTRGGPGGVGFECMRDGATVSLRRGCMANGYNKDLTLRTIDELGVGKVLEGWRRRGTGG